MRVLISGGAGFLASHLSDLLLSQGHEVVAVDNFITGKQQNIQHLLKDEKFSFVQADVIEPLKIDGPVDRIYHMASPASPIGYVKHQIATVKVNSQGTWNLLELSLEKNARFLMASTSEAYGDPAWSTRSAKTTGATSTPSACAACTTSRNASAKPARWPTTAKRGADTRIIRIFNTYGPRMDPYDGRVVISFIRQALNNEPLTIFGEGQQTRSLCYVTDLVRGINLVMENDFIEPINLGNPEEVTILQIARDILALIPESTSSITHHPMPPDDPRVRCPDITRAKQILGWTPTVGRPEGLKKMIDFYRDQLVSQ